MKDEPPARISAYRHDIDLESRRIKDQLDITSARIRTLATAAAAADWTGNIPGLKDPQIGGSSYILGRSSPSLPAPVEVIFKQATECTSIVEGDGTI